MKIFDKIMSYITEYSYGHIGNNVARKFLLTGRVDVYHVDTWIKATNQAAKLYKEQHEAPEAPEPSTEPAEVTPRARRTGRVNAADFEEPLPPAPIKGKGKKPTKAAAAKTPVIDHAAVRRRQQEDVERLMRERSSGKLPKGKKGKGKKGKMVEKGEIAEDLPIGGDSDFFAQKVEAIAEAIGQIQFSSATGFRDLQSLRVQLLEAIDEYRGIEPGMPLEDEP